jgi:catechol 2,3-dioxygenase-like lactoylglutathione lyase family enzyme
MITGISQVIIPVADQERATEFWTTVVGFELRTDARYGATERWIEVAPPDSAPRLVLSPRRDDDPRRSSSSRVVSRQVDITALPNRGVPSRADQAQAGPQCGYEGTHHLGPNALLPRE